MQLLGITKAAVQSDASFRRQLSRDTTAYASALASKVDTLVGLKENVVLGHLIPAGTGFRMHKDAEVRIRPEALEEFSDAGYADEEEPATAKLAIAEESLAD